MIFIWIGLGAVWLIIVGTLYMFITTAAAGERDEWEAKQRKKEGEKHG